MREKNLCLPIEKADIFPREKSKVFRAKYKEKLKEKCQKLFLNLPLLRKYKVEKSRKYKKFLIFKKHNLIRKYKEKLKEK